MPTGFKKLVFFSSEKKEQKFCEQEERKEGSIKEGGRERLKNDQKVQKSSCRFDEITGDQRVEHE